MLISNKVYDVTKYLEDHPGGEEVLLDKGGMDATDDFEDVGHSREARRTLQQYELGELQPSERKAADGISGGGTSGGVGVPAIMVLVAAAGIGYYFYLQNQADAS